MKTFKIQDREAGNVIEFNLTYEKAEELLKSFEDEDKKNGDFVPDFYEIVEEEKEKKSYETLGIITKEMNQTFKVQEGREE